MTEVLAILSVAVLAVLFGLLYRHRGCGECSSDAGGCGGCARRPDPRESRHA